MMKEEKKKMMKEEKTNRTPTQKPKAKGIDVKL